MKILWAKTDFLHPTTRGGQIRTLEMLRQLHKRHEVHYIAFNDPAFPEGLARSTEYSTHSYPVSHQVVSKSSPLFAAQLLQGLISELPVAGLRYRSKLMKQTIDLVTSQHRFDAKVCDFLFPSVNIGNLADWTLFQHNVESVIWERHAQSGRTRAHRAYFAMQAKKMLQWEQLVCRSVGNLVAVSETDAALMESRFVLPSVSWVPTGVDTQYFERPTVAEKKFDLVFVGSMDWMPNIDGIRWFLNEVFPLIRKAKPDCSLAIVGRNPPNAIVEAAKPHQALVTGTVPDVRPYLWQSLLSIVPLRIGGGTRLKIFEAMAAGVPVVSTTIGVEGLPATDGLDICIGDTPAKFASECLKLLDSQGLREKVRDRALGMVVRDFSWGQVTSRFEEAIRVPATVPAG